ncbi:S-layer homology domain-containing protein [Paenibacillus koleovorans]|uniref:S-layer homology domain-containing protein n=1 Tax=Paenibacillus koleovorans TaxID=121608 RepID=UPI0013E3C1A3|nr:S-layer homology domain-containing protein [Paenibacillus koleovorans]
MKKMLRSISTISIATAVAFGGVAGIPSDWGKSATSYAASLPSDLLNPLNDIHGQLTSDELSILRAVRDSVMAIDYTQSTEQALVTEIWSAVQNNTTYQASPSSYPNLNAQNLLLLAMHFAFPYDVDGQYLLDITQNPTLRGIAGDLAKLGGLSGLDGANGLGFTDVSSFINAIIEGLKQGLSAMSPTELIALADNQGGLNVQALEDKINQAITAVLNDTAGYKFSSVLSNIGITPANLIAVKNRFQTRFDLGGEVRKVLAIGYIRSQAEITTTSATSELAPRLTVLDIAVPNSLLTWTSSNGQITYNSTSGKFILSSAVSAGTSVTTTVTASEVFFGKLLFTGQITLTAPSSTGGEEPGNGIENPPTNPNTNPPADPGPAPGAISEGDFNDLLGEVEGQLNKILSGLPVGGDLDDDSADNIVTALEEAYGKAATLNVSDSVEVKDGKAKLNLDEATLSKQFDNIANNIKKINEKAGGALEGSRRQAAVTATLSLGNVPAGTTELALSQATVEKAKAAGVDKIAIEVNGVTFVVDLDEVEAGGNVTISLSPPPSLSDFAVGGPGGTTLLTVPTFASDTVQFTLTGENGAGASLAAGTKAPAVTTAATTSVAKPFELKIPVTNPKQFDTELLTLAKIADGKLVYYVGKYDAKAGVVSGFTNTLGKYIVVQNNVAFSDMASVKDWAGRQVEVVAAKGIIEGRENGQFVPGAQVTRAEFAKMLVKALGVEDASAKESFDDVNGSDWFSLYVASAVKIGLVNGRTDKEFAPNEPVTRAEMATMAARALQYAKQYKDADSAAALKGFQDAGDIHATLKSGVALAASKGIIIGEDDGVFNPNGISTRAQAAVVLYRLINK